MRITERAHFKVRLCPLPAHCSFCLSSSSRLTYLSFHWVRLVCSVRSLDCGGARQDCAHDDSTLVLQNPPHQCGSEHESHPSLRASCSPCQPQASLALRSGDCGRAREIAGQRGFQALAVPPSLAWDAQCNLKTARMCRYLCRPHSPLCRGHSCRARKVL